MNMSEKSEKNKNKNLSGCATSPRESWQTNKTKAPPLNLQFHIH